jgi:hypothetical protein
MDRVPSDEAILDMINDMASYDWTREQAFEALIMTTDRTAREVADLMRLDYAEAQQYADRMLEAAKLKHGKEYGYHVLRERASNCIAGYGEVPEFARDGSAGFIMGKRTPEQTAQLRSYIEAFRKQRRRCH